ncbi:conserved hypothetical protein [Talaromyces stipitatus ATCC 10500]|uniref:Uncharacterized protein n=1 Tax=Talaromyces stipitatus (strain ATCC 10500 / CBS 375.48 / QM 6759 / NRRL 1006) TaxID=441959 RepID=B8MKT8_TALSN|nr:uncharacterized protein TSTA_044040 [Talaromyces stipitatus ATCC 10500]EED14937.1 conserved hypothetical protein [Talaromyces stipitatus ATCC 10500]
MFNRTLPRFAGFVYRENRVPYYQRLFQSHDGKRQWWKTGRSGAILYPYYISLYGTSAGMFHSVDRLANPYSTANLYDLSVTLYAMIRITLGHKTFFGKD